MQAIVELSVQLRAGRQAVYDYCCCMHDLERLHEVSVPRASGQVSAKSSLGSRRAVVVVVGFVHVLRRVRVP